MQRNISKINGKAFTLFAILSFFMLGMGFISSEGDMAKIIGSILQVLAISLVFKGNKKYLQNKSRKWANFNNTVIVSSVVVGVLDFYLMINSILSLMIIVASVYLWSLLTKPSINFVVWFIFLYELFMVYYMLTNISEFDNAINKLVTLEGMYEILATYGLLITIVTFVIIHMLPSLKKGSNSFSSSKDEKAKEKQNNNKPIFSSNEKNGLREYVNKRN